MRMITVKKNIKLAKFTPIAIAEDREIALECVDLLKSHAINARTNIHSTEASPYGVTILVQNKFYDDAFAVIHESIDPNGFFDISQAEIQDSPNLIQPSANPTQAA